MSEIAEKSPSVFETLELHVGQTIDLMIVVQRLHHLGFGRVVAVGAAGDYAVRGGILDIFPPTFECPVRIEFDGETIASIRSVVLATGEAFETHQAVLILPIHGARVRPDAAIAPAPWRPGGGDELPIAPFLDLRPGDLAVHSVHGIARYHGMERIATPSGVSDHLALEFSDGDRLYVPTAQSHLVQRYVGVEGRPPVLSRLGSNLWQRTKERVRQGVRAVARELLQMQAARVTLEGHAFGPDTEWQTAFERRFPYVETLDQRQAIEAVKHDMEAPKPMDRLICGDVGYGKTEVALRAAFKAVMDGRQVAMLVPTTILAEQHCHTFSQRMRDFPVTIRMLSRFQSARQQAEVVSGLRSGAVDIVIGTHRLLSGDVRFKELGLVVIDEEQRFGVRHKEQLKRFRLLADVLTMTATPIPRTLYMALMGARDLSMITTPPERRLPVETRVCEYRDDVVREAIERELARGGQTFIVHYRVQGIEGVARRIAGLVPRARIGLAHGQMPSRQLECVMLQFIRGQIDVLISTTIIESGIDIPNANTLIVLRAETFGLADLYQLRGRVGRFTQQAYTYCMIPTGWVLSSDAKKRLAALEEHAALGSGFKIAMEDLQIRGAGNLLGEEQHGHIMAVGFDLYCRLLREAVTQVQSRPSSVAHLPKDAASLHGAAPTHRRGAVSSVA